MNKETKQALSDALNALLNGVALQPQEAAIVQNAIDLIDADEPSIELPAEAATPVEETPAEEAPTPA